MGIKPTTNLEVRSRKRAKQEAEPYPSSEAQENTASRGSPGKYTSSGGSQDTWTDNMNIVTTVAHPKLYASERTFWFVNHSWRR